MKALDGKIQVEGGKAQIRFRCCCGFRGVRHPEGVARAVQLLSLAASIKGTLARKVSVAVHFENEQPGTCEQALKWLVLFAFFGVVALLGALVWQRGCCPRIQAVRAVDEEETQDEWSVIDGDTATVTSFEATGYGRLRRRNLEGRSLKEEESPRSRFLDCSGVGGVRRGWGGGLPAISVGMVGDDMAMGTPEFV